MLEFERKAKPAIGPILGHEIRAVMGSVLDVYFFVKFAQGQRENPAHQKEWQTLLLVVRKPSRVN
jgi:hypothetical protein